MEPQCPQYGTCMTLHSRMQMANTHVLLGTQELIRFELQRHGQVTISDGATSLSAMGFTAKTERSAV